MSCCLDQLGIDTWSTYCDYLPSLHCSKLWSSHRGLEKLFNTNYVFICMVNLFFVLIHTTMDQLASGMKF
jgi:hypothetical protein